MDTGEMMAHAAGEGFDDIESWRSARRRSRGLDDWFYDDDIDDKPNDDDDE
jgi:hypothetical protein